MIQPQTRKVTASDTFFGTEVRDPYRWLEDVKSPEVKSWMEEQDAHARGRFARFAGRERIVARLKELFYLDAVSVPIKRGNRYFYTRRHADREKAIVYWREGKDGPEHVLLDPNGMSADGSTSLGTWVPTWDGSKVAYALRPNNADEATLYVRDVATGKDSAEDVIPGAKYATPQWTPDGKGFYYTLLPMVAGVSVSDRPGLAEVRFHRLGSEPVADPVIHPKTGDPKKFIWPALSRDGRWLFIYISLGWGRNEVSVRDLHDPRETRFHPLFREPDSQAEVVAWKKDFYILTNFGAPRWRIMKAPAGVTPVSKWRTIVPERKDAVISDFQIIGERLVLSVRKNAFTTLEVASLEGKRERPLTVPAIGEASGVSGNEDEEEAYFRFESFTIPPQVFETSVKSGQPKLWAEVKVPIDPSPFAVDQVWYPSKDGTKISMFVIRRKDLARNGATPFLLYGYGGFNVSQSPTFSSGIYPWLEAGGGFAVANLRGGGEYGEDWHRAGMLLKKQNVFDDFIGAAEFLIREGYTKPERLAIRGGSNGGLLVGAALTQRPELFRAVVCEVPLLDMVRYHLFGSGKTWISEYGSSENEEQFRVLHAYSPYHRLQPGMKYPSVLFHSADSDDRVDPLHARKMTAALQAVSTPERPVLLRIEANAGHGGGDMIKKTTEKSADTYAFLFSEMGMERR